MTFGSHLFFSGFPFTRNQTTAVLFILHAQITSDALVIMTVHLHQFVVLWADLLLELFTGFDLTNLCFFRAGDWWWGLILDSQKEARHARQDLTALCFLSVPVLCFLWHQPSVSLYLRVPCGEWAWLKKQHECMHTVRLISLCDLNNWMIWITVLI